MTHDHMARSADGTRIAWSRHSGGSVGQGSTVVLVHGITESARSFDPTVDRLSTIAR